jgi:N-methylhydantoinase A
VPFEAGIASAMGLLVTPLAFDLARTMRTNLEELTPERFRAIYDQMVDERVLLLEAAGVPAEEVEVSRALDMRYRGQGFNVEVGLPRDLDPSPQHVRELFEAEYERIYALTVEGVPVEVYNFTAVGSGPEHEVALGRRAGVERGDPVKGRREAYFGEGSGFLDCTIYDRYRLRPGASIVGPSIIEEATSTCVVPPGAKASVDGFYNIVIELG